MRTSVVLLIAVVGGYFAYHLWFAPEDVEQEPAELVLAGEEELDEGGEEADPDPLVEDRPGPQHPLDLRVGGGGYDSGSDAVPAEDRMSTAQQRREDAAWKLYNKLKDARNAKDAKLADKIAVTIQGRYRDTDAARLLLFAEGRAALQAYAQLGRTAEG